MFGGSLVFIRVAKVFFFFFYPLKRSLCYLFYIVSLGLFVGFKIADAHYSKNIP